MDSISYFYAVYEHLITNAMIYSIVALSLYFSLRAGIYNLSQVGFMALGAYVSALLTMRAGWPWLVGVLVAAGVGAVMGLALAYPVIRLRGHFLAIATLSFGAIIPVLALNFDSLTGGASGLIGVPVTVTPLTAFPFFAAVVFIALRLHRSRPGRAWDAIRVDEATALASGVNLTRYKLSALVLSSVVASVGGALFAFANRVIVPQLFDFGLLTNILVFALLGGIGHPLGPVLGALVVSTMPEWLSGFEDYRQAITGVLLVLSVIYTPGGLVQMIRAAYRAAYRRLIHPWKGNDSEKKIVAVSVSKRGITDLLPAIGTDTDTDVPALEVEDLTKRFSGLDALKNVSLRIGAGEVVALIGPNGAGKTTLVNCITGLQDVNAGSVAIGGVSMKDRGPHYRSGTAGLARTFQTPRLLAGFSVRENVLMGTHAATSETILGAVVGGSKSRNESRTVRQLSEECLDYVGFAGDLDGLASGSSYGDQRKIELARALAMKPKVLLFDEPAAGLTKEEVSVLGVVIRELATRAGIAVLVIDHNMSFVMDIADRIYVLSFGEMIAEGTPQEVRKNPEVIRVYLGADPISEAGSSTYV